MLKKCINCGKEFNIPPSRYDRIKFCSRECRKEYTRTTIKCAYCGKEFEVYKRDLPRKKYCSRECEYKSMENKEEYTCEVCGKKFFKVPSRVRHRHVYCSHECAAIAMQNRETKKCVICGKQVTRPKSQFKNVALCSKECTSKYYSLIMSGEKHPLFNSIKMKCWVCGKEFYEPKSRVDIGKGKFCSKKCKYEYFSEHFAETLNPNWHGGAKDYRGPNWKNQRKKALIRDEFTCQICGATENIQVHHKKAYKKFDGNWKEANKLSNLITLCGSCHCSIEPRIKKHKSK
ncbi:HNH endonuclease [Clostridium sp. LBM24168]